MLRLIWGHLDAPNKGAVMEKDMHKASQPGNFPEGVGCGLCCYLDTPQKQIPLNKTHSTLSPNSPGKKMLILSQLRCLCYDVGCII